jgi:LPXTG-motif cell wall-anchored protein
MKNALAFAVLSLSAAAGIGGVGSTAFAQDSVQVADSSSVTATGSQSRRRFNAPAPLIAGGIPGALVLGGAYLVVRRRRRKG